MASCVSWNVHMIRASLLVVRLPHHATRLRIGYGIETFEIVHAHDLRCDELYVSAFPWYLNSPDLALAVSSSLACMYSADGS